MADFNTFKQKAAATASYIADKSVSFAKTTAWRTKILARIAKHKSAIASEKDIMKKTYMKLGQKYYEMFSDKPDANLQQFCELITMSEKEIDKRNLLIEELRESMKIGPEEEGGREVVAYLAAPEASEESEAAEEPEAEPVSAEQAAEEEPAEAPSEGEPTVEPAEAPTEE